MKYYSPGPHFYITEDVIVVTLSTRPSCLGVSEYSKVELKLSYEGAHI